MPTTSNGWTAHDWRDAYSVLVADWSRRTGIPLDRAHAIYWPTDRPPIHRPPTTGRTQRHGVSR